jgi:hypothetical protein
LLSTSLSLSVGVNAKEGVIKQIIDCKDNLQMIRENFVTLSVKIGINQSIDHECLFLGKKY